MSAPAAFANEPVLELRRAAVRDRLAGALGAVDRRLPIAVPVLIAGDRAGGGSFVSADPGRPDVVVAECRRAGEADARDAVAAAEDGGREWAGLPGAERASVLVAAAALLREQRLELAALAVRECAKPWPEADADVCEAIDFLEYYARAAIALDERPRLLEVAGERNDMRRVARGVAVVIAPWNFPLAIAAGMTAAALAAGNAVVLKPAEQAPACALAITAALHAAGVPPAALSLLPGYGDAGAALVSDPRVQTIAFTGSGAVGQEIIAAAAHAPPGQRHVKRVVAEMGGKNCIIADADADLDEVVPAIVASAFGFAGQKCSACSRVLAHEAIAEDLLRRLGGATRSLRVGQAEDLATDVGPVIDADARARVEDYASAVTGATITTPDGPLPGNGWFCPPRVVAGVAPGSSLLNEEVFGPLVTVEAVPSVEAACEIVESLPVALTGGLFSRDPAVVAAVARRSPVGNLYVNRPITGAMVGRQPFGGNRRSGTGAKAGGPGYVEQFTDTRVVTENTVRHGLVVE